MIGSTQFIKLHDLNYDCNWKKKKKPFDIDVLVTQKKKAGVPIRVVKQD